MRLLEHRWKQVSPGCRWRRARLAFGEWHSAASQRQSGCPRGEGGVSRRRRKGCRQRSGQGGKGEHSFSPGKSGGVSLLEQRLNRMEKGKGRAPVWEDREATADCSSLHARRQRGWGHREGRRGWGLGTGGGLWPVTEGRTVGMTDRSLQPRVLASKTWRGRGSATVRPV